MMPGGRRRSGGFSVVEAMAGAALAAIALAGLATVATNAAAGARRARDVSTAIALATARLEALRAGPAADGADRPHAVDGTAFTRTWTTEGGRGLPLRLRVRVAWDTHAVELATEALR
jgi:Tfp pilus assembly protein PilV